MTLPGTPSLVFLVILLVGLPLAAIRSARQLRAARDGAAGAPTPTRRQIWASTLVLQSGLWYLAWAVGRRFGCRLFAVPRIGMLEVLESVGMLLVLLALRALLRRGQTEAERRQLMVFYLAPRTPTETALRVAVVLVASVAEEAAYRGVGFSILWYALGNPWLAAGVVAVAFGLAHTVQGWKSAAWIVVFALLAQGLVALTGTLVFAMVVHALYDLLAGHAIAREARRRDAEGAWAGSPS